MSKGAVVTSDLAEDEAASITAQIRDSIRVAWQLIAKAYEGRAWLALGYETWDSYLNSEFGAAPLRVPREDRPVVVASLRDAGMSTRAIAAATGISKNTVGRTSSGVPNGTPDSEVPAKATGLDGKQYPRSRPAPAPARAECRACQIAYGVDRITPSGLCNECDSNAPSNDELDKQLDERMEGTATRFRANWATAVCRAGELRTFDLDRAVEVCDRNGLELTARAWREWAADLEQRLTRSHLRVIGGSNG